MLVQSSPDIIVVCKILSDGSVNGPLQNNAVVYAQKARLLSTKASIFMDCEEHNCIDDLESGHPNISINSTLHWFAYYAPFSIG